MCGSCVFKTERKGKDGEKPQAKVISGTRMNENESSHPQPNERNPEQSITRSQVVKME